jgi:hypothetical protein
MESDWGKSVNMLISSAPFGELFSGFTTTKRQKQGFYVSVCLNKTTLQKNQV